MNEIKILYKKNGTFSIKRIKTTIENLDTTIKDIENGLYFADIELSKNEAVDIIDINYLQNGSELHIILHFAIIEFGL